MVPFNEPDSILTSPRAKCTQDNVMKDARIQICRAFIVIWYQLGRVALHLFLKVNLMEIEAPRGMRVVHRVSRELISHGSVSKRIQSVRCQLH